MKLSLLGVPLACAVLIVGAGPVGATAAAAGRPVVTAAVAPTGPARVATPPGPPLLYWPAADAPQLQNARPWRAAPILISGASAYRGGEFLYQDFLNDDHGRRICRTPWIRA